MDLTDLTIYLANLARSVGTLTRISSKVLAIVRRHRSTPSLSVYDLPDEDFCFMLNIAGRAAESASVHPYMP